MLLNRTRTLGAISGLVGGALLLAGCGQPAAAPQNTQGTASDASESAAGIAPGEFHPGQSAGEGKSTSDSKPAAGTTAGGQASGSGQRTTGAKCTSSDFKVDLNVQPDRPGVLLMAVTNNSQKVCDLNGWPTVTPLDMSNSTGDVPTQQVEIPGGPTEFSLDPGETGFAGVLIEFGDKGDSNTFVATGFQVGVPGASDAVNTNIIGTDGTSSENGGLYAEFPIKSMKVGTLQPAAQGVTVFD
ncbi:DUF4232 domain-containing protein [Saccharopolyspora sp. NPDC050389]|uniref:DUF4232 domain-containing protein n=1 Tax=Saccharopolyspora sp. NPDC050389 TaxID=3155516 RepID=UPI0033CD785D